MVHTVELLDWATGGPVPEGLEEIGAVRLRSIWRKRPQWMRTDREDCHGKGEKAENQSKKAKRAVAARKDKTKKSKRPQEGRQKAKAT